MAAQIDILLATCNSSAYLPETIDSILHQDCSDWRLVVSDGGSTDSTLKFIEQYTQAHPEKITVLPSEMSLSACNNFSRLLRQSKSSYVMFCDHDDIWLPDKISKTFNVMEKAEKHYGTEVPILIFTDKKVVDENLNILNDSDLQHQNLNPQRVKLNCLIFQNVPSGCTMMLNRPLVDLSSPIPPQAVMHDHWVSLVTAAFGKIIFVDEPTMLYRQHGSNYYGAPRYGWGHFYQRYRQGIETARTRLNAYIDQAMVFYDRYGQSLQPHHHQMLAELSQWYELSWLSRRKLLFKHRIFKTGIRRNLGMFLIV